VTYRGSPRTPPTIPVGPKILQGVDSRVIPDPVWERGGRAELLACALSPRLLLLFLVVLLMVFL
jgi:hypothetical protein